MEMEYDISKKIYEQEASQQLSMSRNKNLLIHNQKWGLDENSMNEIRSNQNT